MFFNLVSAAVVCAILDKISGFDPSSDMIDPSVIHVTVKTYLPPTNPNLPPNGG